MKRTACLWIFSSELMFFFVWGSQTTHAYSIFGRMSGLYANSLTWGGASLNLCLKRHNLRKADDATLAMCVFQLRVFVNVIPRYLYSLTSIKGWFETEYWNRSGFFFFNLKTDLSNHIQVKCTNAVIMLHGAQHVGDQNTLQHKFPTLRSVDSRSAHWLPVYRAARWKEKSVLGFDCSSSFFITSVVQSTVKSRRGPLQHLLEQFCQH